MDNITMQNMEITAKRNLDSILLSSAVLGEFEEEESLSPLSAGIEGDSFGSSTSSLYPQIVQILCFRPFCSADGSSRMLQSPNSWENAR